MKKQFSFLTTCLAFILALYSCDRNEVKVDGDLKTWHKVTLNINGPEVSETGTPNPFLIYRFDVTFRQDDEKYVVPGYFAADGNA
ncbi:MAG: DUF5060 domain-containing protein, partial [Bacteroidota bacterium]